MPEDGDLGLVDAFSHRFDQLVKIGDELLGSSSRKGESLAQPHKSRLDTARVRSDSTDGPIHT
jgi:hypothetical protein